MNESEREDNGQRHGEFLAEIGFDFCTHEMREPLQDERDDGEEAEEAAGEEDENERPVDGTRFRRCDCASHGGSLMKIGIGGRGNGFRAFGRFVAERCPSQ